MTGVARDELEITDLLFRWGQARDSELADLSRLFS